MLLTPGEAVNRPDSERSKNREIWPHAFIKLPGNARALADNLLGNHLHMAYGAHVAPLTEACNFLNITQSISSQPASGACGRRRLRRGPDAP